MKNNRCHLCENCQFIDRWEARYKKFLKENPSSSNEKWIEKMKKEDNKYLPCFYNSIEPESELLWAKAFENI